MTHDDLGGQAERGSYFLHDEPELTAETGSFYSAVSPDLTAGCDCLACRDLAGAGRSIREST